MLLIAAAVGAFVLIAVLVAAPDWVRRVRYRPGLEWNADVVWFNGPGDDTASEDAVRRAAEHSAERAGEGAAERAAEQGARRIAGPAAGPADPAGRESGAAREADVDPSTGGARATW